ncbi:U4/U6.U5 small nuclear ribonucleoprotein 27 kDa protein-like isoform X2 [Drosophila miranda]|uniref:U4/U6.U5 small nuclear ribonucleoprotein 27 kDa protein-like isoform X2 n=1 Tax=Drosophila miranda TaxID=7229 RepID=UPI00143F85E0|nr:U4/U6.U5 small nuclear ribonucleoprotein 27 kDa protein-like isoform X2 [Drosophila miranda]
MNNKVSRSRGGGGGAAGGGNSSSNNSSSGPSTSRRTTRNKAAAAAEAAADRPQINDADLEGKSPEEVEMLKTMGFCTFDTTKNKKVEGNDVGEVHVILKRKYRQYMNRKGGFNRPLDFVA